MSYTINNNYNNAINKYKNNSIINRKLKDKDEEKDKEKKVNIKDKDINKTDKLEKKSEEKNVKKKDERLFTKMDKINISIAYKANFLKKVLGGAETETKNGIFTSIYSQDEFDELGNQKLADYMKTATDKELEEKLKGVETDEDKRDIIDKHYTPENTSDRIVNFATMRYDMWAEKGEYSHKDPMTKLNRFYDLIKGAIAGGFSEARKDIGTMPDEIDEKVSSTYDLTMDKFQSWFDDMKEKIEEENENLDESKENTDKEIVE